MKEQTVSLTRVNGETEAQQLRAFLEAHGIACEFHGEALRNTHGLTIDGLGAVEIRVWLDQADEAQNLLIRMRKGEFAIDDESMPETEGADDAGG